ncbi:serine/threonine protein kinase [Phlyctema vagabunda]|uniref:Serine/threonine protein kinase n=1 Tax=Phlyctema vagabunda TaxID=108571 RepID=A0ABR4PW70_9HELO
MPQASEIVKPTGSFEESSAATIIKSSKKFNQNDEVQKAYHQNPDIYSLFSLTSSFDIAFVDLTPLQGISQRDDVDGQRRIAYGLGAGVSCSLIQHETNEDTVDICPAGTLVAHKKYSVTPAELQDKSRSSTRRLHQLIWQELQIFCHPYLRKHENICQLVYIGWEETNLVPILALELASHGTLEDCLQHLRSYGSSLRKSNLSLDIGLGLAALHSCGIVHGDVKPSNIIIQAHPSRNVVAKLSDFNGASHVSTYGNRSQCIFGTPTWQPPEVLCKEEPVDWLLADVYAYGMAFATIWSATGYIPEGGTFLDPFFRYKLATPERELLINIWKLTPDGGVNSMLDLAKAATASVEEQPLPLELIISNTLSCKPSSRLHFPELLRLGFSSFAESCNREIK